MNTQHLKFAVEIARIGSITEAANALYMSQPQLSKLILDMERTLGFPIFKRSTRGVVPTSKGEKFLAHARNILEQVDIIEHLYRPDDENVSRLDAAVPRASYIADTLYAYLAKVRFDRNVKVDFRETNSHRIIKNVASGDNTIGIVRFNTCYENYFMQFIEEKDLHSRLLYEFDCQMLMSKKHPLVHADYIDDAAAERYTEVNYGDLTIPLLPVSKMTEIMTKLEKRKSISVYDRQSQYEILSRYPCCFSLCSPVEPDMLSRYDLVQRDCGVSDNHCKDVLIYRRGYVFSEDDKRFIKLLEEKIEKLNEL